VAVIASFGCIYGAAATAAWNCSSVTCRLFDNGSSRFLARMTSSGMSPSLSAAATPCFALIDRERRLTGNEKGVTPGRQRRRRHVKQARYQFQVFTPQQSQHCRCLALSRHPAAAAARRYARLLWSHRLARPRSNLLAVVHDTSRLAEVVRL
jgi:hypothetical protein